MRMEGGPHSTGSPHGCCFNAGREEGQWPSCGEPPLVVWKNSRASQVVQKLRNPEPLNTPNWLRARCSTGASGGESDMGRHGAGSPGVISVPLVHRSPGSTQLFLISSSHGGLGIPEGFWEHRQGKGNDRGLVKPVRKREDKTVTTWAGEVAFPVGEPRLAIHCQTGGI